jgi:hypothetical protein
MVLSASVSILFPFRVIDTLGISSLLADGYGFKSAYAHTQPATDAFLLVYSIGLLLFPGGSPHRTILGAESTPRALLGNNLIGY